MQLRGRELRLRMRGDDVAALQEELAALGLPVEDELGFFGRHTRQAVQRFQEQHGLEITGEVDPPTATVLSDAAAGPDRGRERPEGRLQVSGRVGEGDGTPVVGALVQAHHRGFRSETTLGRSRTDRTGRYSIDIGDRPSEGAAARPINLFVTVLDERGEPAASSEDDVRFDVRSDQTIDLAIGGGELLDPPEVTVVTATVRALTGDVAATDLSDDDIEMVAGAGALDRRRVENLVESARLGERTGLPPEVFYAFAHQELPAALPALLRRGAPAWRAALARAVDEHVVAARHLPPTDEVITRLSRLAIDHELTAPGGLGDVLRSSPTIRADEATQRTLVAGLLDHEGSLDELWAGLAERGVDAAVADDLRLTLEVARLTDGDLELAAAVQAELRQNENQPALRHLATWDQPHWERVLASTGAGPGRAPSMRAKVEELLPSAVVVDRLIDDPAVDEVVTDYLQSHPDFAFDDPSINRDGLPKELDTWQRLFPITPLHQRYEAMRTLIDAGLGSAQAIVQRGPTAVLRSLAPLLGEAAATEVWTRASQAAGLAMTVLANYGDLIDNVTPYAIPAVSIEDLDEALEGAASLRGLLGSHDYCECEHCKSVYSPAAYFVDLLSFLCNREPKNGRSPLSVLLARRPELAEIELSCVNTNTVLPYVDLVNEALENAISWFRLEHSIADLNDGVLHVLLRDKFRAAGFELSAAAALSVVEKGQQWRVEDGATTYVIVNQGDAPHVHVLLTNQTTGTEDELSVQPEHLNPQAYEKLAEAVYPWALPFDLWSTEARLHLKHLGFERHAWMETLATRQATITALDVASDHLSLGALERELICGRANRSERDLWGVEAVSWPDSLRQATTFLTRAGFDMRDHGSGFRRLRELVVGTRYLNGGRTVTVPPPTECDLSKATIDNDPTAAAAVRRSNWEQILGRARRFLRLQRKLGWTTAELDKAITAFGADLDADFLEQVSGVERLRARLGTPLLGLLAWWGPIDTAEDWAEPDPRKKIPSLYEQLFLDKSLVNPANEAFLLDQARTELADTTPTITEHGASVVAALQISAADLERLVRTGAGDDGPIEDRLDLANLSALYRHVSLARSLGLSVKDVLAAIALTGADPFAEPRTALELVKKVGWIRDSGFSVSELDYLLRHEWEVTDAVAPTDTEMAAVVEQLRDGFRKVIADTADVPSPDAISTADRLALVLTSADAEHTVALLGGIAVYSADLAALPAGLALPAAVAGRVTYDSGSSELRCTGPLTIAERALLLAASNDAAYQTAVESLFQQPRQFLTTKLGTFLAPAAAVAALLDTSTLSTEQAYAYVLTKLNQYLRTSLSRNVVKQKLATALGLDQDVAALILETLVDGQVDTTAPVIDDFLEMSEGGLSAAYHANLAFQGAALERIDRTIDFDWSTDPPPVAPGPFSGRWTGMLRSEASGTYTLRVETVGQARLRINERVVIDAWSGPAGPHNVAKAIELEAGKHYAIEIDYRANDATGNLRLSWTPPSAAEQVVAAARLTPTAVLTSYRLLHKLALLVTTLEIQADELRYLCDRGSDFAQFDLNAFPVTAGGAPAALFEQWERLREVFAFRDRHRTGRTRLIDIFGAAHQSTDAKSISEAKRQLCVLTGWEPDQLDELAGATGFQLTAADYRGGRMLPELDQGFRLMSQLGISAAQLTAWAAADLSQPAVSREVKEVVRAKYSQERWLEVARPIRDLLRAEQRTALIAYLVHDLDLDDADDLYARFLIDTEMDPCMLTSRLKQAISSVQLFVQRSLVNLEPDVELSPGDAREWRWRKNYRVWEANRKVFLYPENWIEPELRDDKSPFFEELENELLQSDVTEESAEVALLHYLEKLKEVSRLDIVGLYDSTDGWHEWTSDTEAERVLHVFGRTPNSPHVLYYRRWIDQTSWTPWERVDLDVSGDHLVPVVWNRRLFLLWPILEEKSKAVKLGPDNEPSIDYWELTFGWSEYKRGAWTTTKVAEQTIDVRAALQGAKVPPVALHSPDAWVKAIQSSAWAGANFVKRWSPTSFHFKQVSPLVGFGGELIIRCYLTAPVKSGSMLIGGNHWPIADFHFSPDEEVSTVTRYTDLDSRNPILCPAGTRLRAMAFEAYTEDSAASFPVLEPTFLLTNVDNQPGLKNYLAAKTDRIVLGHTSGRLRLLTPHQELQFDAATPFFVTDDDRVMLVEPDQDGPTGTGTGLAKHTTRCFTFHNFSYPHARRALQSLRRYGLDGVLDPSPGTDAYAGRRQLAHLPSAAKVFFDAYLPSAEVATPHPIDDIDFGGADAYSQYNWELYFHIPLLIADRLTQNQRFEEAMRWYHYVFDPTLTPLDPTAEPAPERYWKVRPFYEAKPKRIQQLMLLLNQGDPGMTKQVRQWAKQPFKPHVIARLRTSAYMKTVVMKYIDNLIAWGDQLFRRDTIESTNEATQLYLLAREILGDRAQVVPARSRQARTFTQLRDDLDLFSNALVQVETALASSANPVALSSTTGQQEAFTLPSTLYFCVPANDMLLGYWDTVEDRLFKIRHCMNIGGVVRQLPLFEPPIDPALLVRAAAAGIDISSVLDDLHAPRPHYRFAVMAQKAIELCAEVRSFGAAFLAALERRDAEDLTLLRSRQEVGLLGALTDAKRSQVREAKAALGALEKAAELVEARKDHYEDLVEAGLNANERLHLSKLGESHETQKDSQAYDLAGSVAHLLPSIKVTKSWPPSWSVEVGGPFVGRSLQAYASALQMEATSEAHEASTAAVRGSYDRRREEWEHQVDEAEIEAEQLEKRVLAAEIGVALAEAELAQHRRQVSDAKQIDAQLRSKFTDHQLYRWMVSQVSALFFQTYQLAYDLAKRAEKAFQHELGLPQTTFIEFGYWDSLKKGLLAGERLHVDLRRMETAYLEQNAREYEITKHVSVALLHPEALIELRQSGECYVSLPEALFDLDYPGHYRRRLKTVGLTIPCVTGSHASVNGTLTLQANRIRTTTSLGADGQYASEGLDDARFMSDSGGTEGVAISGAQNDSGMFELSFHDERYLPFEGAGAISTWHLQLPKTYRQFDYDTIADVVLHLGYTARHGGAAFRKVVEQGLDEAVDTMAIGAGRQGLHRLLSARHDFSSEWSRFAHLLDTGTDRVHQLDVKLTELLFPHQFRGSGRTIAIQNVTLILVLEDVSAYDNAHKLRLTVAPPFPTPSVAVELSSGSEAFEGLPHATLQGPYEMGAWQVVALQADIADLPAALTEEVQLDGATYLSLDTEVVKDVLLLIEYGVKKISN